MSGPAEPPLDDGSLAAAARELGRRDPDLEAVRRRLGPPPLWARPAGFATLVRIVLEQQVSLASARAAFERLAEALGGRVEPGPFLGLDDDRLRAAGFSRQKAGYCRGLAATLVAGELDLDELAGLPSDQARRRLLALRGVGGWTADIYLLMALCRPDVWPAGDLALAVAAHRVKRLAARPSPAELEALAEAWRPWRAVAARMLWQDYLSRRQPSGADSGQPSGADSGEHAGGEADEPAPI